MPPAVVVFARSPADRARAGRTIRALRARGLDPVDITAANAEDAAAAVAGGPVWLVRAGAWPARDPAFPPPSATGKPLCAVSAVLARGDEAGEEAARWRDILARSGGDLARLPAIPPITGAYCEEPIARRVADHLLRGASAAEALAAACDPDAARLVRFAPLDLHHDDQLRVLLAVTSLQQGGAERVVLDLFAALPAAGVRPLLAATGRPTRAAFPVPAGLIDLAAASPDRAGRAGRAGRADALAAAALAAAADLVHAHLLPAPDLARLAARDLPVVVTVHNTRAGWPEGLADLRRDHADLLVACSLAAEADLRAAGVPVPARTAWNGIDAARLQPSPALADQGAAFRRRLGIDPGDLVLLAVANPRPQKRLERLPAVLAAARDRTPGRGAHLVIAGDAAPRTEPAATAARALREAIAARGVEGATHLVGSLDDVAPALAAADVLISTSAHEGLSLAHLEALAAGLPVVATDAGGTREIAGEGVPLTVLPVDADPAALAEAIPTSRPPSGAALIAAGFSRDRMAARYADLYPRAIAARRRARREGLVIITNNFSTGGAQSSARRLLTALRGEGERVRAATLQEQPAYPTPGRRALEAAGVPVFAVPDGLPPAQAAAALLDWIDAEPPRAVLFWNALADHKIRLADALIDVPVFDASPGEMYFASLDRHLARARPGSPYRDARAYGARLAGVIVKFTAEAARAAEVLGAPVHVIPNGVVIGARPPPRPARDRLVIGTAARLSPQKKLGDLIDAFRLARPALGSCELRVAGGPERGSEDHAAELHERARGLDVAWIGEVPDAAPLLADLDIFAMISEPAGCPNASLEAMAAGLPIVATDVGGAADQILDGVTGRLVPRGDADAFAAALVQLARDPALRARMGEAARARAEDRFDVRRMVADYRRVCLDSA